MTLDSIQAPSEHIGIVGMAGRFPGAGDLDAFWRQLRDGVESISFFSIQELLEAGVDGELVGRDDYVPAAAVLEDAELFDAELFGLSAAEAALMDPQIRVFLECAQAALDHAGQDPGRFPGRIGVFAGMSMSTYAYHLPATAFGAAGGGALQAMLLNDKDFLSTWTAYTLDLRGPAITVQTACSTSLTAVHLACQSLLNGECDLALAGGVSVPTPQKAGYLRREGDVLSADGHCRAFDARASGTVRGAGCGLVVLRRLEDTLGDTVYAVVRGSATNHDGAVKGSFTAPGIDGQVGVVAEALEIAGVSPETLSYIEAHGTGTAMGDPIEVAALTEVFRAHTDRTGFCALGSVKTNIGHLDAAAGIAGLLKTVLALGHRQLPPSLHFESPNPEIDFARSPFRVNAELADWPAGDTPRRAGVSAFGMGGGNVHVVLEEAPPGEPPAPPERAWQLLALSARTPSALAAASAALADHLERHPPESLADVAHTLALGRKPRPHRRAVVAATPQEAIAALRAPAPAGRPVEARADAVFLFPGQGAQAVDMARGIYDSEPTFRHEVDRCCELLAEHSGLELAPRLYPGPAAGADGHDGNDPAGLIDTRFAQPALFVVSHALARLWISWGVEPAALLGHSVGEYAAACLAGVFSLEDALQLVAARGALLQALPPGEMLAVRLTEAELTARLDEAEAGWALAAVNGAESCVASGPAAAIAKLAARLAEEGIEARRLRTSHAFHSAMMEPALDAFEAAVRRVALAPPQMPVISNLTGRELRADEATDPAYWRRHLRHTVRFAAGVETLLDAGHGVFLEVGPGRALSDLVRRFPAAAERAVVASLPEPGRRGEAAGLVTALGRLWRAGLEPDWQRVHGEGRRRVGLPGHPFERRRYWLPESDRSDKSDRSDRSDSTPALPRRQPEIADWFYAPSWKRAAGPADAPPEDAGAWLVLTDSRGLGAHLAATLRRAGRRVAEVHAGEAFAQIDEHAWEIDPDRGEDFDRLVAALEATGGGPRHAVHLWPLDRLAAEPELDLTARFFSLLDLVRALTGRPAGPIRLACVTEGLHPVLGHETLRPEQALVLGPCLALPHEEPGLRCAAIDVELPAGTVDEACHQRLTRQILGAFAADLEAPVVACRGPHLWTPICEPRPLGIVDPDRLPLRRGGVYLVTGGLGGVGMALARQLAEGFGARLVLTGRRPLPPRDAWPAWLAEHGDDDPVSARIRDLEGLEAAGAEVLTGAADVADFGAMDEVLRQAEARFGRLDGVIHAAGVAASGLARTATRAAAREVLAPKVQGTRVLERLLRDREVDFVVLCASVTGLLGGFGQADYTAANAFLDAFAQAQHRRGDRRVIAVDWEAWRDVGMAARAARRAAAGPLAAFGDVLQHSGLSSAEGAEVLRRALASRQAQVVVSTVDFEDRRRAARQPADTAGRPRPAAPERHPRPELDTAWVAPRNPLEERIAALWEEALGISRPGVDDSFFDLGGNSLIGISVVNRLQEELGETVHITALLDAPTIAELAAYLAEHYPASAGLRAPAPEPAAARPGELGTSTAARFRRLLAAELGAAARPAVEEKNPRAVFVLSAPRSGSTLLRVLLGGHPALFAPPELDLLPFATLAERRGSATQDASLLEGAPRALMAAMGCDAAEADRRMARYERDGMTVPAFYRHLQEAIGDRLLVEKSPTYALFPELLRRAEELFDEPRYIHLVRHPRGMIRSSEEARLDLLWRRALRDELGLERRQLAELVWRVSEENLRAFFADLPPARHTTVRFEDLVRQPRAAVEALCTFLEIDFDPGMLTPYAERSRRMTDGLHPTSRMIGDVKFHRYERIEAAVAERWRDDPDHPLAAPTRQLAADLGYADLGDAELGDDRASGVVTHPLSHAQERFWAMDRLEPESAVYNILCYAVRLEGELDVAALAASLAASTQRHEILRTVFAEEDGAPLQRVMPAARRAPLGGLGALVDLGALAAARRRVEAERRVAAEARRVFDLERGPLWWAGLVRLGADEHILTLTIHHIVSDAWSIGVLMRELEALYPAFRRRAPAAGVPAAGAPAVLDPLTTQYGDYARAERRRLGSAAAVAELAAWRERLAGLPPVLELPADRPRPRVQSHHGGEVRRTLPEALATSLEALAKSAGATLLTPLLAAFQALLARLSRRRDIPVGTPVSLRRRAELEPLVGLFMNTVVVRTQVDGELPFLDLVRRVREDALDAFRRPETPFDNVVEALHPPRSAGWSPVFQVLFGLQDPRPPLCLPGLEARPVAQGRARTQFDLTLWMSKRDAGLVAGLEYNLDLFEAATAERLLAHFQTLLEGAVADPEICVARLPLLSAGERRQLLAERHTPLAAGGEQGPIQRLVAAVARRTPEAIAVVFADRSLSYRALDEGAGRLAAALRQAGLTPGGRVGLVVERSEELPRALLGIWKAGGAAVPIDPRYPAGRIDFMIRDAGLAVLLSEANRRERLAGAGVPVLDLATGVATLVATAAQHPTDATDPNAANEISPRRGGDAGDPAYVMYTSGSTGRPKGVLVPHRPAVRLLEAMARRPGLEARDVLLAVTSISFDIAILELVLPLVTGARLVIADAATALDGETLRRALVRHGVRVLQATPATWRLLLETSWRNAAGVRVWSGGEALAPELAGRLLQRSPEVWNLYGPTETTIWSAVARLSTRRRPRARPAEATETTEAAETAETADVHLGRPIAGTAIYIVEPGGEPAPAGLPGELLIGGAGLTVGYLGRPALTTERFVPDPWSGAPGARCYRTGDLARYRPAGELEFFGRLDQQLKIRGFRIEPGEIEAALARQPAVRAAAVVADGTGAGRRLVAYVVAPAGAAPTPAALRAALAEELPEPMLPAAFVRLDALPLLPNGKLDRQALPRPERAARLVEGELRAPRTPTEELLASLWSEVLELEAISVDDDFFALGGQSLLAARLISRVRETFGVELSLRSWFTAPTIAGLARRIDTAADGERALPPPTAVSRQGPLPLSFAQQRMWFLAQLEAQLEAEAPSYNMFYAVRLRGRLAVPALRAAVVALVARHETLRTTFLAVDGQPVQQIAAPHPLPLPVVELGRLGDSRRTGPAEWARLARQEARRPFDLARGPLVRLTLLRRAATDHLLLLSLHHILADAWSMGVLARDLAALYNAHAAGRPADLPALPVGYADYAVWQRRTLEGEPLERQLAWWRRQLAGLATLELPADRPRPAVHRHRGALIHGLLPPALSAPLDALGRRLGATLFMTLLAAFKVLLSRLARQTDLAVGVPAANRNAVATEALIGFFLNTLTLRTDLARDPSFPELVARVREVTLGAHAHQDLPFEKLVEELEVRRDLSRTPLFQVMFVFNNAPAAEISLHGLELERLPLDPGIAKFDLMLLMWEDGDGALGYGLEYSTDLFDRATIERLAAHLGVVLGAVADDAERRISVLPVEGAAARHQILREANDTARRFEAGRRCEELVADQAGRTPDAIAVVASSGQGSWHCTYAELERRAARLAGRLRRAGAGPGTVVAALVSRGLETAVALLGILKSGAAVAALDPSYPPARLRHVLDDARPVALVTQGGEDGRLAAPAIPTLRLEGDSELEGDGDPGGETRDGEGGAPRVVGSLDEALYVIYTSGSTGEPKGIVVSHRAVLNLLAWQAGATALRGAARTLQFTTFGFCVSFQEMLSTWSAGGTLVVAAEAERANPELLLGRLAAERVERLHLPFAALRQLAETALAAPRVGTALRDVISAGEPLRLTAELRAFFARSAPCRLHNQYGASETHVVAARALGGDSHRWPELPPAGRPIANVRLDLLGGGLGTVPLGAAGELCVAGEAIAGAWYLRRPALTAMKFIPDPLSAAGGGRRYRTGDLARRRPDGEVEILGRADAMVKIRGFRVEPAETELALRRHPAIADAAVLAVDDPAAGPFLAAWLVAAGDQQPAADALRTFLGARLPAYMIPQTFTTLEALPVNAHGKLDREALPSPRRSPAPPPGEPGAAPGLEREIAAVWRQLLHLEEVDPAANFFDLGGHSLLMARVHARLRSSLGVELSLVELFQYPTVRSLAEHLARTHGDLPGPAPRVARAVAPASEEIAIVGMTCRFPGADGVEAFWRLLRSGTEAVRFFSVDEVLAAGADPAQVDDPAYVRAGAVVDGIELFDADFFGFTPHEAAITDPQQRLFLECAWHALEHAGYVPGRAAGRVGVYAGAALNTYLLSHLLATADPTDPAGLYQYLARNDKDFLAPWVSYKLDLEGPGVSVQTACSTSLAAVHLACQALRAGECEMALAGGATVSVEQAAGYLHQEGMITSPDGHCRAFDAAARGTVQGSGVGAVVLKPLAHAVADGDRVWAVIRGSAMNNDGNLRAGFTAPGVTGQAAVIREALARAAVDAADIGYIEAHGTGTPVGDPIEVTALTEALGPGRAPGCRALGSVKTNVGHLGAAAGVAGLIKTALALAHREIPPSLHFERPHPEIDFDTGGFIVNTTLRDWPGTAPPGTAPPGTTRPQKTVPRRAGVSSFGIGGTNVHAVLEEAPVPPASRPPARAEQLLCLSARTASALDTASARLARHLEEHPEDDLADVAFTLQVGRRAFAHRRTLVAGGHREAAAALRAAESGEAVAEAPRVAFLFPGQGAQHVGMLGGLYRGEALFREAFDRCCEVLRPWLGEDLRSLVHPSAGDRSAAADRLAQTRFTQPALFATGYALAELWRAWGVVPGALLGHSLGEWLAAQQAGIVALDDALALVAERGRLLQATPAGAMLGVALAAAELEPLLAALPDLDLAATNGPERCTVAGAPAAIAELEAQLAARGVARRRLDVSHAFHSPLVEPAVEAFARQVGRVALRPPRTPVISNVTGTWLTPEEAMNPGYWARQMRATVRFADGVATLLGGPPSVLLEVGPAQTLTALVARQGGRVVASARRPGSDRPDTVQALDALGRLWRAGVEVDWRSFAGPGRRRVPLPGYPFEGRRYWIEASRPSASGARTAPARNTTARRPFDDWFYIPSWERAAPLAGESRDCELQNSGRWLIFADSLGIGARLAESLHRAGAAAVLVKAGDRWRDLGRGTWLIDPGRPEHYDALFDDALLDVRLAGAEPPRIVHLWSLGLEDRSPPTLDSLAEGQLFAFDSLYLLAQALARRAGGAVRLAVVSNDLQAVTGDEALRPEKALLLGLVRSLPREVPGLAIASLDLPSIGAPPDEVLVARLAGWIVDELTAGLPDPVVAYRGRHRWLPSWKSLAARSTAARPPWRQGGTYLITGGLGGLGRVFAEHLARTVGARLVLVGRSPLPPPDAWDAWLAAHPADDVTAGQIRQLRALEEAGAEVLALTADVADPDRLRQAVVTAEARFGPVHGVLHAAGVAGGADLAGQALAAARAVLAPKTRGALNLHALFSEAGRVTRPDFLLLCSSLASVLGDQGLGDYAAANAWLDAFAADQDARGTAPRVLAVGWGAWSETGLAARAAVPRALEELHRRQLRHQGIASRDGRRALERVLAQPRPLTLVSPLPLAALLAPVTAGETDGNGAHRQPRPELEAAYQAPSTDTERALAEIWQDLFGIERVGIDDSFLELGGDSLLATQAAARIERRFGLGLTVRALFENVSINEQAAFLEALLAGRPSPETGAALNAGAIETGPIETGEL